MKRRELLALGGSGVAGLAGCLSSPSEGSTISDTEGATSESSKTEEPTTTVKSADLDVAFDSLQPGVVMTNVDYFTLHSEPDSQYLFLRVSVSGGSAPSLSEIFFRFDGNSYSPMEFSYSISRELGSDYTLYEGADDEDERGWVIFELPETGAEDTMALVWPGGMWRPDDDLKERLGAPYPTLTLEKWHVPDSVAIGDAPVHEFTVHNEGDYPGRFIAGINWRYFGQMELAHRRISQEIPPGETRSWEVSSREIQQVREGLLDEVGDDDPDLSYELLWPGGEREKHVRVMEAQ